MKWISVNDELPDFGVPVLVSGEEVDIARLESILRNSEGVSLTWLEGKSGYDNYWRNITHWQKLPENVSV